VRPVGRRHLEERRGDPEGGEKVTSPPPEMSSYPTRIPIKVSVGKE